MDEKNKKIEQVSFDDLLKNYLVEAGEEITTNEVKSSDIIEHEDGNCTIAGHEIEANACSMIKDDYKI